jgi:hypothetical protein
MAGTDRKSKRPTRFMMPLKELSFIVAQYTFAHSKGRRGPSNAEDSHTSPSQ